MVRTLTDLQTFVATWKPAADADPIAALHALEQEYVTKTLMFEALSKEGVDPATLLTSNTQELTSLLSRVFAQFPVTETSALKSLFAEASIAHSEEEITQPSTNSLREDQKARLETARRMFTEDAPTVTHGKTTLPTRVAYTRAYTKWWVSELAREQRNQAVLGSTAAQEQAASELARVLTSVPPQPTIAGTKARITEALPHVALPMTLTDQEVEALAATTWNMHEVAREIVRSPDIEYPEVFTREAFTQISARRKTPPPTETIMHAARYQAKAELTFEAEVDTSRPPIISFDAIARGPLQRRVIAPLVNTFFTLFPKAKEVALEAAFAKSVARVLTNTELLQERLGADVVSSGAFQQFVTDSVHSSQTQADGAGTAVGAVNKLIAGTVGEVFSQGFDEPTLAYLTSVREGLAAKAHGLPGPAPEPPELLRLYYAAAAFHTPHYLHFFRHEAGGLVLRGAMGKLAQTGVGQLAQKGWAALLAKLGLAGLTGGTSLVPTLLTTIGGGLLNFFSNVIMGASRSKQKPWYQDGLSQLALGVVLFPLVFIVLAPLLMALGVPMLNLGYMKIVRDRAAIVQSAVGGGEVTGDFPAPNYDNLEQSANICINYTSKTSSTRTLPGTTPGTTPSPKPQDAFLSAVNSDLGKGLGLFSCVLNCPAQKITFNQLGFKSSEGYWGWAPNTSIGTVHLYSQFYTGTERARVRLIAHEMMHQVQYLNKEVFDAYYSGSTTQPKGYCGQLGTYEWNETASETFAEAGAMYIIGDPYLRSKCAAGYDFMDKLFSACR